MADLGETLAKLRALDETGPKLVPLPDERQIAAVERDTGVVFPPDFRRYLLEASDIMFDVLEPVTVIDPEMHTHFPKVLEMARDYGVPADLIPLCEDNADFTVLRRREKLCSGATTDGPMSAGRISRHGSKKCGSGKAKTNALARRPVH